MMQSKVSVRGQTVIPQEIREQLGIKPETRISWWTRDGILLGVPIPDDPIAASRGMLKGSGFSFQDFFDERNKERELERRHYDRMLKRTAPKRKTKRAG